MGAGRVTARTSLLARLIGTPASALSVSADGVVADGPFGVAPLGFSEVASVDEYRGAFWTHVVIHTRDARLLSLRRLARGAAGRAASAVRVFMHRTALTDTLGEFERGGSQPGYLTHSAFADWSVRARQLLLSLRPPLTPSDLPPDLWQCIERIRIVLEKGEAAREARNSVYVAEQARRHAEWLDAGQGFALTPRQRDAILHDEDNNLVVAGAGTGKTSTVVGKVGHVLQAGLARPEEILLLAFTRKAQQEMAERLDALKITGVAVRTFHALGMEIIAAAEGKKPTLSKLAEEASDLRRAVAGYVEQLFASDFGPRMAEFWAYFRHPYRSPFEFKSEHDYFVYLKGQDLRTILGETVKSHEECMIANWLFMHGVAYEYERSYEHDTASIEHRQYKPDFYLPGHRIYIEHFGVNRKGGTAPYVDSTVYAATMTWKRQLHRQRKTTLVETYSYEHSEGTLFSGLETKLKAAGVPLRDVGPEEMLRAWNAARAKDAGGNDPLIGLLGTMLNLFKGNQWSFDEVRARASGMPDGGRLSLFIEVFERVHRLYEADLTSAREIDFNDMIRLATSHAIEGRFRSPFRYVIVDEFQDISRGRALLLKALLDQVPGRRLFCVGDDWQSIFRFTGSDISVMTGFSAEFGATRRTDLDRTYRFNDKLLDATSRFVTRNPDQLSKSLVAGTTADEPSMTLHSRPQGEDETASLRRALSDIGQRDRREEIRVMVIGRYHHTLPENAEQQRLARDFPHLKLRYLTAHGAKGLEDDYAILLGVIAGKYGFPSQIADDPVLDLLLAKPSAFPNAEERRLFYVALTRARRRAYVLTEDARRSPFADELEGDEFRGLVLRSDASARPSKCAACKGGTLLRRESEFGVFWGCSNYPLCEAKATACPKCGAGALVRMGQTFRCGVAGCDATADVCPKCTLGFLRWCNGPFGRFLGCSEFRREGPSCDYTRNR